MWPAAPNVHSVVVDTADLVSMTDVELDAALVTARAEQRAAQLAMMGHARRPRAGTRWETLSAAHEHVALVLAERARRLLVAALPGDAAAVTFDAGVDDESGCDVLRYGEVFDAAGNNLGTASALCGHVLDSPVCTEAVVKLADVYEASFRPSVEALDLRTGALLEEFRPLR